MRRIVAAFAAPVVCPAVSMEQRFAGQIVGMVRVLVPRHGGELVGIASGPQPGGPEPLSELTIVQGDRLVRTDRFEHRLRSKLEPGSTGYHVKISSSALPGSEPFLFVTSACLPDHPVSLRVWESDPMETPETDPAQAERFHAYMREVLAPEVLSSIAGFEPTIFGGLATRIPGCDHLSVLGDATPYRYFSALVCLDAAGAVTRTVLAPFRNLQIYGLAALDVDGDGVDELIVKRHEPMSGGTFIVRSELLWYDAADDRFKAIDLGPTRW